MELERVCSALSNPTRIRLLQTISQDGPKSSAQLHESYVSHYDERRRETIYKSLEQLVEAGLLEKYYDKEESALKYRPTASRIQLDLAEGTVEAME